MISVRLIVSVALMLPELACSSSSSIGFNCDGTLAANGTAQDTENQDVDECPVFNYHIEDSIYRGNKACSEIYEYCASTIDPEAPQDSQDSLGLSGAVDLKALTDDEACDARGVQSCDGAVFRIITDEWNYTTTFATSKKCNNPKTSPRFTRGDDAAAPSSGNDTNQDPAAVFVTASECRQQPSAAEAAGQSYPDARDSCCLGGAPPLWAASSRLHHCAAASMEFDSEVTNGMTFFGITMQVRPLPQQQQQQQLPATAHSKALSSRQAAPPPLSAYFIEGSQDELELHETCWSWTAATMHRGAPSMQTINYQDSALPAARRVLVSFHPPAPCNNDGVVSDGNPHNWKPEIKKSFLTMSRCKKCTKECRLYSLFALSNSKPDKASRKMHLYDIQHRKSF